MSNRDIEAILMWDITYPRRRRPGSPPLDLFMTAMELRAHRVFETPATSGTRSAISRAAFALASEGLGMNLARVSEGQICRRSCVDASEPPLWVGFVGEVGVWV